MLTRAIRLSLVLLLVLSGCQTMDERKQSSALEDTLRRYEGTIRWGNVDNAQGFRAPDAGGDPPARARADLRVTSYEVVQGPTMLDETTAVQIADIQYTFDESPVLRSLVDQQVWKYDETKKHWQLQTPVPRFK
ncbi:asparagine synthetase [bacterium endosymbiont of Escarpia laminata]|nr:MAG: asparagine synthetase [bacterium endosymbiont of Escarpia laminata]